MEIYEEYFYYYIDSILIDASVVAGYLPSVHENFIELKKIVSINNQRLHNNFLKTKENLKKSLYSYLCFLIAILLISSLITFMISFLTSKSINKRINKTISSLELISKADFTQKIEDVYQDEIGIMENYFNNSIENIKNLLFLIKEKSLLLQKSGFILSSNMKETAIAINEISSNIQSIKNQTINQSASVTETTATMEQITKGVEKLNDLIENQSTNVSESSSAIEEMIASINNVTQTLLKNSENINSLINSSSEGKIALNKITDDKLRMI